MSDLPESAISPRSRERLNRLEALHAQGFWSFARVLCLWCYLPITVVATALAAAWIFVTDFPYTSYHLAADLIATPLLYCICTLFAWRLTPWAIRYGRRSPSFTCRQWEAFWISLAGFLLILVPWLYLGLPDLGQKAASETELTIAIHAWIVGIVAIGWGWLRWLWAKRQDSFWRRRSWMERFSAWLVHPMYCLMAGLTGVVLMWNAMHQLGTLDSAFVSVMRLIPF